MAGGLLPARQERRLEHALGLLGLLLLAGAWLLGMDYYESGAARFVLSPWRWGVELLGQPGLRPEEEPHYWGAAGVFGALFAAAGAGFIGAIVHARLGKSRFYKMLLAYTSYISSLVLARNSLVIARAVSRWSPIRGPGFHGPIIDFWIEGSRRAWHAAPLLGAAAAAAAVLFAVYAYEWIVRERGRFPCGRASAPVLGVLLLALVASASLGHVVLTLPGGKAPLPVVRWEASRTLVRVSIEDELGGRLGWAQALARVNGSLVQIPLVMRGGNITIYLSALGGSRVEAGYVELLAHIYYPWGGVGVLRARIPIGVPAGATVGMDRIVLHASNTGGTILVWGSPVEGCRLVDHVEVYSEWLRLDASTTGFNETCHAALPGAPSYYIKVYYWDAGRLHVYTRGPLGPGNTTIVVKLPGGRG